MLFKEKLMTTEAGFENYKAIFNKIIEDTLSELEKQCLTIGDGKTADIKILNEKNNICLKVVDNAKVKKNNVFLKNKVNEEIEFLDKLDDPVFLNSIGIKRKIVPQPMFSKQESQYGFLFEEKIKGMTLKDLIDNDSFNKLPTDFNWDTYFNKLEDIVTKLNKAKIFHRDLHEGNIFINEAGEPILIDFGDAYESFLTDEDPYREELFDGSVVSYKPDITNLKEIKQRILEIIQTR